MAVKVPPIRENLVDNKNGISRAWLRWFQSVHQTTTTFIPGEFYIFRDTATRDSYFTANPQQLEKNILVALALTEPFFVFQKWDGVGWITVYPEGDAFYLKGKSIKDDDIMDGRVIAYSSYYDAILYQDIDVLKIREGSSLQRALSGDLELVCVPSVAATAAATLNAAPVGTFKKTITIKLQDSEGYIHKWAQNKLIATTSVTTSDTNIVAPGLDTTSPVLGDGEVVLTLTYDTDAGATKTYSAGDIITLTVSSGDILGYTIPNAVFKDTLV